MNKEVLEKTANKMMDIKADGFQEECPIGIIDIDNWEWPQGIGMYGLYSIYKQTGNKYYLDFLVDWYDRNIAAGLPERNVNTTAPMLALTYLYEITGRKDYLDLIKDWAQWIYNDMPKTQEGAIQHTVSGEENRGQIWIDTLFMTVLFLARAGVILDYEEYKEEAKKQFLIHIKYLYDKKTGLWYHGWTFEGRHNFANAFWARGNCWFTAGACEIMEILNIRSGAFYDYIRDTLRSQADALVRLQSDNGGWHTLLDDNESYLETSAVAGFGYGLLKAVRVGMLDESYRHAGRKALEFVERNIDDSGLVGGVSYGTGMGHDLDHYRNIPICPMTYGQSMAILILTEGLYETA